MLPKSHFMLLEQSLGELADHSNTRLLVTSLEFQRQMLQRCSVSTPFWSQLLQQLLQLLQLLRANSSRSF